MQGIGGAHEEHVGHINGLRGLPAGDIRVKSSQVPKKRMEVADVRDVPAGDGTVLGNGGSGVVIEVHDGHLQLGN